MNSLLRRASLVFLACGLAAGAAMLGVGSTRDDVVQLLGKPKASAWKGPTEILYYSGGTIDLLSGKVARIDQGFDTIIREQAKGLVKYDGQWITPDEAAQRDAVKQASLEQQDKEAAARPPPGRRPAEIGNGKVEVVSDGGRSVNLGSLLVPGKVTIVDFYADWCGPCRALSPKLEQMAQDPDVYLRKVDIVNWHTDVAKQFGLNAIPSVRVYDRAGNMVGSPSHTSVEIAGLVKQAK